VLREVKGRPVSGAEAGGRCRCDSLDRWLDPVREEAISQKPIARCAYLGHINVRKK